MPPEPTQAIPSLISSHAHTAIWDCPFKGSLACMRPGYVLPNLTQAVLASGRAVPLAAVSFPLGHLTDLLSYLPLNEMVTL